MTEAPEAAGAIGEIEAEELVRRLKAGAPDRQLLIEHAYRVVFRSDLGRIVLMDHLQTMGVSQTDGPGKSDAHLRYGAGMRDAAILLAEAAGYGATALAALTLSNHLPLEEAEHDDGQHFGRGHVPGPGEDF